MKKALRSPVTYVLLIAVGLVVAFSLLRSSPHVDQLALGDYLQKVDSGQVASATLHDGSNKVTGRLKAPDGSANGDRYEATYPDRYSSILTQDLLGHKVAEPFRNTWKLLCEFPRLLV